MADSHAITIPVDLPRDEACAFAALLKRTAYDDCLRRASHRRRYADGREEVDVMWSALRQVEHQFAEAGFGPCGAYTLNPSMNPAPGSSPCPKPGSTSSPAGGQLLVTFSREGDNEHMQICEDGDKALKAAMVLLAMQDALRAGDAITVAWHRRPTLIDQGLA